MEVQFFYLLLSKICLVSCPHLVLKFKSQKSVLNCFYYWVRIMSKKWWETRLQRFKCWIKLSQLKKTSLITWLWWKVGGWSFVWTKKMKWWMKFCMSEDDENGEWSFIRPRRWKWWVKFYYLVMVVVGFIVHTRFNCIFEWRRWRIDAEILFLIFL